MRRKHFSQNLKNVSDWKGKIFKVHSISMGKKHTRVRVVRDGWSPCPHHFLLETFIYRIVLDTLHTHQQTLVSRIWPLLLLPLSWSQPCPLPSVLIREARGSLLKIKWVIAFLCWNSPMACFPYHSKQKSFTTELVPALSGARGDMEGDLWLSLW